MNTLTGNKDTDFLILNKLNDYELTRVCQANRYIRSLCNDDNFWLRRIKNNFNFLSTEDIYKMKNYLNFSTIKELYQYLVSFSVTDGAEYTDYTEIYKINRNYFVNLFKNEELIDSIIDENLEKNLPKWINRQELIYELRRKFPNIMLRFGESLNSFAKPPIGIAVTATGKDIIRTGAIFKSNKRRYKELEENLPVEKEIIYEEPTLPGELVDEFFPE